MNLIMEYVAFNISQGKDEQTMKTYDESEYETGQITSRRLNYFEMRFLSIEHKRTKNE